MTHTAIAVFTGKSVKQILELGGSKSWLLSPRNARQQRYLVCVRNASTDNPDSSEEHGSAFLVGEISGLLPLPEQNGVPRWQISIANYGLIDRPRVWNNRRNPVRYTTLEELGINLDDIALKPLPVPVGNAGTNAAEPIESSARRLTIAEAKAGLAATFDVNPEAVEITIRG